MKRILVKLSGEMLCNPLENGIDGLRLKETAKRLANVKSEGYQLAVVMGGGNIFRGSHLQKEGLSRTASDQMGMLATLMNGLALKSALVEIGVKTKLFSALDCPKVAESFQYDRVISALQEGELIIFVAGTGHPFFTTDTCAALRSCEINADLLVKATKVNGVYDKDPSKGDAKKFDHLSWSEFIERQLKVMDLTAVTLCMNEKIPIFVTDMGQLGLTSLENLIKSQQGTLIKG